MRSSRGNTAAFELAAAALIVLGIVVGLGTVDKLEPDGLAEWGLAFGQGAMLYVIAGLLSALISFVIRATDQITEALTGNEDPGVTEP